MLSICRRVSERNVSLHIHPLNLAFLPRRQFSSALRLHSSHQEDEQPQLGRALLAGVSEGPRPTWQPSPSVEQAEPIALENQRPSTPSIATFPQSDATKDAEPPLSGTTVAQVRPLEEEVLPLGSTDNTNRASRLSIIPRDTHSAHEVSTIPPAPTKPIDARRLMTNRQIRRRLGSPRPPSKSSPESKSSSNLISLDTGSNLKSADIFWQNVVEMLWKLPIEKDYQIARVPIYISHEAILHLTGVSHQNVWVHNVRDGCQVHVQNHNFELDGKRLVYLKGSPRAIELTKRDLLLAETFAQRNMVSGDPDGITIGPSKAVESLAQPSFRNIRTSDVQIVPIDQPEKWTVRTFADHVESLVADAGSSHMKRLMAQDGQLDTQKTLGKHTAGSAAKQYYQLVGARLADLFSDPRLQHCISSRAQDDALSYLMKYYQLRQGRSLDLVLSIISQDDLVVVAGLWNHMLYHALQGRSLSFVKSLFDFAQERRIVMNWAVAMTIIRLTNSIQVKVSVCKWLAAYGFLETDSQKRDFTHEVISDLFQNQVLSGGNVQSLFNALDTNVGDAWSDWKSFDLMLLVCTKNKWLDEGHLLLDEMQLRNIERTARTMSHIFCLYYKRSYISGTIKLFNSQEMRLIGRQDRYAIAYAFMTAYNKHYYNTSRVLYQYAALKGVLTYAMRQVCYWSLIRNSMRPDSRWVGPNPRNRAWKLSVGKIIGGVGLDVRGLALKYPELCQDGLGSEYGGENPMKWLYLADVAHRDKQKELVREIMRHDERAVLHLEPGFQLSELVTKAYEVDLEWAKDPNGPPEIHRDRMWVLDNMIQVPVKKREKMLDLDGHLSGWNEQMEGGKRNQVLQATLVRQPDMITFD